MHYDWLVISCETLKDAQDQLNRLDVENYEIYHTEMFESGGKSFMSIVARRPKKPAGDIRY